MISEKYCDIRDGGGKRPILKELLKKGKTTCPEIGIGINLQLAKKGESWKETRTIITRKIRLKTLSSGLKKS